MKKIFYFLMLITLMTGCGCESSKMLNTPTKRVEMFFANYQTLDEDVLTQLNDVIDEDANMTDEQKEKYRDIMKKHYQNITYDVKDETINGDDATVTVEVEVTDYSKAMLEADTYLEEHSEEFNDESGNYDKSKFYDYRLEQMKDVKDKVKYTLEITLTKIDDEWIMDDITDIDEKKIHGVYNY